MTHPFPTRRSSDLVALGAQSSDINMGCPAKKVCRVDAGSALLRDEALVARICAAVVSAVAKEGNIPVTLKIRTGFARTQRNGVAIARIAEDVGDRKSTRLNSSHSCASRMPSSA